MVKKKLPKSIRKYIRREKSRIRREVLDLKKQKELIDKLYPARKPILQKEDEENKVSSKKNESF